MNKARLFEKLKEPVYRAQFVAAQIRHTIAAQIKSLREDPRRRWTQAQLGERAGMKQNAIARLENPQYGDYNVKTLLRIAGAFDVGLIVRFAPFGEIVHWNQTVSPASYVPVSFEQEPRGGTHTTPVGYVMWYGTELAAFQSPDDDPAPQVVQQSEPYFSLESINPSQGAYAIN
jgi:HTH-type transcriptional regulator / antitoxin HipB